MELTDDFNEITIFNSLIASFQDINYVLYQGNYKYKYTTGLIHHFESPSGVRMSLYQKGDYLKWEIPNNIQSIYQVGCNTEFSKFYKDSLIDNRIYVPNQYYREVNFNTVVLPELFKETKKQTKSKYSTIVDLLLRKDSRCIETRIPHFQDVGINCVTFLKLYPSGTFDSIMVYSYTHAKYGCIGSNLTGNIIISKNIADMILDTKIIPTIN